MTCDACGGEIDGERLYKAAETDTGGLGVYHPDCIARTR
ncbi:hypothetical protein Halxa_2740 [Halopiger xanaduensis SH-6]|uniref:Uncharacterized protein n=1 Tax=Halopiger xanaduensis (strain DSM 18323 / JCM 14033 / SH-6) TaxID=797210 RepID=F8D915_HALXS|nr:hypothetical protein Halxa_2740 [Halopiger xanaduensis SH-6]